MCTLVAKVIYCGTIVTEEGKEKKVNIDFEPFKPINTSLYLCDNKFHTEALTALLADDNRLKLVNNTGLILPHIVSLRIFLNLSISYQRMIDCLVPALMLIVNLIHISLFRFGFIVMDGNGALFGTLQGNTRHVFYYFFIRKDTSILLFDFLSL
jgi:peptide chain release factor subunit 1